MAPGYFNHFEDSSNTRKFQGQGLLGAGWRPYYRQIDPKFLTDLLLEDTSEFAHKTLNLVSYLADATGRQNYTGWANLMNLFSADTRYYLDEFWNYITPEPPSPDHRYADILSIETPIKQVVSRNSIAIDHVFNCLQEITIRKILQLLGRPNLITQYYLERYFYYPVQQFQHWERLDVINTVHAYWQEHEIWLQIDSLGKERRLTLMAQDLAPLVRKATTGVAVMLSGYQSRVGQIQAPYPIRTFPEDVQNFTDAVQQGIFDQSQLAVLVSGEPGTGKTAWTQAVAKEILVPLGYVVFILDHDAVENFVPPTYLERICLIINEADNLAQNRALEAAQRNNKTEHILSLLDGTLYQSVIDQTNSHRSQKLVVLMTCNTTERLDPAILRKGRIDLICEFTHRFV
ncbi:ATP-binding protein [Kovacikia minuta CCNUW1]|uniref:AAA family ATPase n=1 Tax=Kovacikia minuta TaxID=2931930 RepID=UPI001CC95DDF|nr:AAA family ATPase [Kovacikia minuta]UBF28971.1 ATP-binding protein [Kovacikia minuta CCNUW1]